MDEIKKFLDELLEEISNRLVDIELQLDDLDIKIKENSRFSEVLKKENEVPFSEFSPRNIVNKNLKEVDKLDKVNEGLNVEFHNLHEEKVLLQTRSDRICNMLAELEDFNPDKNVAPENNEVVDVDSIKESLNNIISFLPSDPMRAKIELANLRNNL